jgi:hypothetical protein
MQYLKLIQKLLQIEANLELIEGAHVAIRLAGGMKGL